jgi:hypothetical protein
VATVHEGDIGLNFVFEKPRDMSLLDLSSTFYDVTLLYDWTVLTSVSEYADFRFTGTFWYRNRRPIQPQHQLYVRRVRHESPVGLELLIPAVVAAAGVPWALLQSFEKVRNWRLNRKKLEGEVKELEARNKERILAIERGKAERDEAIIRSEIARRELVDRPEGGRHSDQPPQKVQQRIIDRLNRDSLNVVDASFEELAQPGASEVERRDQSDRK